MTLALTFAYSLHRRPAPLCCLTKQSVPRLLQIVGANMAVGTHTRTRTLTDRQTRRFYILPLTRTEITCLQDNQSINRWIYSFSSLNSDTPSAYSEQDMQGPRANNSSPSKKNQHIKCKRNTTSRPTNIYGSK